MTDPQKVTIRPGYGYELAEPQEFHRSDGTVTAEAYAVDRLTVFFRLPDGRSGHTSVTAIRPD